MKIKLLMLGFVFLMVAGLASAVLDDASYYYSFDNANYSAPTVYSWSGTLDGTNYGATSGVTGVILQAFDFDSGSDYVRTTSGATGIVAGVSSPRSVSTWFNWDGAGRYLFYEGTNVGEWTLRTDGGMLACEFVSTGWKNVSMPFTDTTSWHHVVCTYDGSTARLYFDGALVQTNGALGALGTDTKGIQVSYPHATVMFDGQVDEFGYYPRELSSAEVTELYNGGAGLNPYEPAAGPTDTLNISDSLPANNSQLNTQLLSLNLTANASESFNANLYVNGALNQSGLYSSGSNKLVDFNLTFLNTTEATYTYYFFLNTSTDNETTSTKTFHIDNVFPQITWTTPANDNSTIVYNSLASSIFLQDPNIFSAYYNITYANNATAYYYRENTTLTGLTNYTLTDVVNFTDISGEFSAYVEVCDGHTGENITLDSITTSDDMFSVEDEGDSVNISLEAIEDTVDISYTEEDSKTTFQIETDTSSVSETFLVESNHYIHILDGLTEYEGHLVMGKKWVDFETDNLVSVDIVRLTDYLVEVTVEKGVSTDTWEFESIGELNCQNATRTFLAVDDVRSHEEQVLSGDISPFTLNVTFNPAYYSTGSANLVWNGTAYPATATNTSNLHLFDVSLTIPPLLNDENVTFHWEYTLDSTSFNTTDETTEIYSPRIGNCSTYDTQWVEYAIKDETFETALNGTLNFLFSYYNNAYENSDGGLTVANYTHPFCMYPSFGNFTTNITIQYQTVESGYTSREFTTTGYPVFNSTREVDLFLLEGAQEIVFHVIDDSDDNLQGIKIEAYRYRVAEDQDVLVESEFTDENGRIIFDLAKGTTFYSFKFYQDGDLVISTARFKLFSDSYEYIIREGRVNPLAERLSVLNYLTDSLLYLSVPETVNYTYNFTGTSVNQWCFELTGNGTQWSSQCSNSSSGAFNFALTDLNITYLATVTATTNHTGVVVESLSIDPRTQLKEVFGNNNTLFISLIIFLTIALLGLISLNVSIILSMVALVLIGLFGLMPLGATWIAGAVAIGLGILWVVNRK